MTALEIHQFTCLSDNFGILLHSRDTGETAAIDAPDAEKINVELEKRGWALTQIFVTHHHMDHIQAIPALKARYGCKVTGPRKEADKIPTLDHTVEDEEIIHWAGHDIRVIETPGHTLGMVNYHFADVGLAFTGDTLFSLGCGRIFEGTAQMMWQSLEKLLLLPPETMLYCGHEYTLANARFALTIDNDNPVLQARVREVELLCADNQPTLPTTLEREMRTNPFLRPSDPAIRRNLGMETADNWQVFAEIRKRKDNA